MWNFFSKKKLTAAPESVVLNTTQVKPADEPAQATSDRINQELYRRNFELAIKNKTLQLLSELYEISTLALTTEELARKLVYSIRTNLGYEIVGIFLLDKQKEHLKPSALSTSDSVKERFHTVEDAYAKLNIDVTMSHPFTQAINDSTEHHGSSFQEIFGPLFTTPETQASAQSIFPAETKTAVLVQPLHSEETELGVLYIVMNRSYEELDSYEKEAIGTIAKVVTIALDKSRIYDQLTSANKHLKELDTAKSEFMSIASHQLRTPLAGIMGYLSMIMSGDYGKVNPEQKQVLEDITSAGQRLTRLVNAFLNATRIEAGRLTINYTDSPFNDVIESMYKELKPTADKKKVKLVYKPNPKLPVIQADVDKLKDVALNLIDNAIKYSPGASVTVWGEQVDENTVRFVSEDTGVGIPAGQAAGLFNKFVRGSGIAQVEPNGSGLGLFIAKKIIEAHGGKIWAESEGDGKGSKFQFEIPIKAANLPAAPGAGAQASGVVQTAGQSATGTTQIASPAPSTASASSAKEPEPVSPATEVKDVPSAKQSVEPQKTEPDTAPQKTIKAKPKRAAATKSGVAKVIKKATTKKPAAKKKTKKTA